MFFILDEMLRIYSALTLALILILTAVCLNPSRASPDEAEINVERNPARTSKCPELVLTQEEKKMH